MDARSSAAAAGVSRGLTQQVLNTVKEGPNFEQTKARWPHVPPIGGRTVFGGGVKEGPNFEQTKKQSDRTDHQPELVDQLGLGALTDAGEDVSVFLADKSPGQSKADFTAIYFDSISTGEDVSVFLADKSPGPRLSLNRSQWGGCSTKYDTPTEN